MENRYKKKTQNFCSTADSRIARVVDQHDRRKARRQDAMSLHRNLDVYEDEQQSNLNIENWLQNGQSSEDFVKMVQENTIKQLEKKKTLKELGRERLQQMYVWKKQKEKKIEAEKKKRIQPFHTGVFCPGIPKYLSSTDANPNTSKVVTPSKNNAHHLSKENLSTNKFPWNYGTGSSIKKAASSRLSTTKCGSAFKCKGTTPLMQGIKTRSTRQALFLNENGKTPLVAASQGKTLMFGEKKTHSKNTPTHTSQLFAGSSSTLKPKRVTRSSRNKTKVGRGNRMLKNIKDDFGITNLPESPGPYQKSTRQILKINEDNILTTINCNEDGNLPTFNVNEDCTLPTVNDNEDCTLPTVNGDDCTIPTVNDNEDFTIPTVNDNEDSTIPTVNDNEDGSLPIVNGYTIDKNVQESENSLPSFAPDNFEFEAPHGIQNHKFLNNESEDRQSKLNNSRTDSMLLYNETATPESNSECIDSEKNKSMEAEHVENMFANTQDEISNIKDVNEKDLEQNNEKTESFENIDEHLNNLNGVNSPRISVNNETPKSQTKTDTNYMPTNVYNVKSPLDSNNSLDVEEKEETPPRRVTRRSALLMTPTICHLRPRTPCSRSTRKSMQAHCDHLSLDTLVYTPSKRKRKSRQSFKTPSKLLEKTEETVKHDIAIIPELESGIDITGTEELCDSTVTKEISDNEKIPSTPTFVAESFPFKTPVSSERRITRVSFRKIDSSPWVEKDRRSSRKKKRHGTPVTDLVGFLKDVPTDGSPYLYPVSNNANTESTVATPVSLGLLLEPSGTPVSDSPVINVWGDSESPDNFKNNTSVNKRRSSGRVPLSSMSPSKLNNVNKRDSSGSSKRHSVLFALHDQENVTAGIKFPNTPIHSSVRRSMGNQQCNINKEELFSISDSPTTHTSNVSKKMSRISLLPGLSNSPIPEKDGPFIEPVIEDLISLTPDVTNKSRKRKSSIATGTPLRRSRRISKVPVL